MAHRPLSRRSVTGVRDALTAWYEARADHYRPEVDNGAGGVFRPPHARVARRLAAGEPVVVPGWIILGACRRAGVEVPELEANARYRIEEGLVVGVPGV